MALIGGLPDLSWRRVRDNLLRRAHEEIEGFTKVVFRRAFASIDEKSDFMDEMVLWLSDSDRPGVWDRFSVTLSHATRHTEFVVYMSDPDVAFEFKMRWV